MIAQDIIRQAGIKNRSSSWYANALMNELLNFQKKSGPRPQNEFSILGKFWTVKFFNTLLHLD